MRDELVKEVTKNEKITELELEIISLRKERLDMLEARHGTSQAQINIPIQILKDKICNLETDLVLKNQHIAELEKIVEEFLNLEDKGMDYDGRSACPDCHGHELSSKHQRPNRKMDHQEDCFFIKARAVLEGK